MNPDACTRCGKCCLNMRPYISLGVRSRDGRIPCECTLTRERFEVSLSDQDMQQMYDRNFQFRYPKACPFLAKGDGDSFVCIIYHTRPGHCRLFPCSGKHADRS